MEEQELGKLNINHTEYKTRLSRKFAAKEPYSPPDPHKIMSFIPGTVVEVMVKPGDIVSAGDDLIILDAMKMKNRIKSHSAGKVLSVLVKPGVRVTKGELLVEVG